MPTIEIIDDVKRSIYIISGYTILKNEDELILEIAIPHASLKYKIHSDEREPDINKIESFIVSQFNSAIKNNTSVCLEEYLIRSYIFIGTDENRKQFTAHKF